MDRRYYLVQDLRWEFSLLDREQKDTITEDQARYFIFCVVSLYGLDVEKSLFTAYANVYP